MPTKFPSIPIIALFGDGVVGAYRGRIGGLWTFEGVRPGPGWHRHDWRPRQLIVMTDRGMVLAPLLRRRWRLADTTTTHQDRGADEVGQLHGTLLFVLVQLWAWLASGKGLHARDGALGRHGCPRTVHRWLHRLLPDGVRLQQALRTAVLERCEPQPVEMLFPRGLSPPEAVRRRRWKDPDATYSLATGLAFLFDGAPALAVSATVLLALAHRRLDGPLGIPAA